MFILKVLGWKIDKHTPEGVDKCVVVMGPHTSNWDFVIGRLAFASYGVNGRFLIKKELFFFPLGWFLKAIGGIPVDRKSKNNMTECATAQFEENDKMFMVFTPEGTRSYNPNWKKGFYYIALKANVPIIPVAFDFGKKEVGKRSWFKPT